MMTKTRAGLVTVAIAVGSITAISGAKPGTTSSVPLSVEVVDDGMRIRSDGQGDYVDGQDGVAASIDQYGNLIINFQTGRVAQRKLHYDYGAPFDGQPLGDGNFAPPNNYFSTLRQSGDTTTMQGLAEGQSQCIRGGPVYTLEDAKKTQVRHWFQRGVPGVDFSDTAFLLATRTPDVAGKRTWTIDSVNGCAGGVSGVAGVVETPTIGKFVFTDRGRYDMPMRLHLTEK